MTAVIETWHGLYEPALRGQTAQLTGPHGAGVMPVHRWRGTATAGDLTVLSHCTDLTLDLGCGPGRMAEAMQRTGRRVLGIDVVPEAVRQARARGVAALTRDLFMALPAEGRWPCALLADGNIGIGGDPVRLLRRVGTLLGRRGRVVVDVDPPGSGLRVHPVRIEAGQRCSEWFPWAFVCADSVRDVATAAGFGAVSVHDHDGRWFAVLRSDRAGVRP